MSSYEMTPGWHAGLVPDAPAIIMGSSGETVTYAELDERSVRFARALRTFGVGVGDHIAILMENNRPYLEVAWAAQRSGLYYTAINTHLHAAEAQYILDDCGAVALVTSERMGDVIAGLDLSRIGIRISVRGELAGFESYDDVLAGDAAPGPLEDECEGREMLYSSGTTGRPKGVRKQLPGTALGDPESAPVQIAQGLVARGGRTGDCLPVPGPSLSRCPARLVDVDAPCGRDGRRDGPLRRTTVPRADRTVPGDAGAVRAHDVRAAATTPAARARTA